jgi:isoprenylcysteine carboxyl methyltransferase (ICMT) family protein YpbQ
MSRIPTRQFQQPLPLPASVARQWVNLLGLLGLVATTILSLWQGIAPGWIVPIAMIGYALPIIILDHLPELEFTHLKQCPGWQTRTLSRTIALYITFVAMLILAWAMPWYQTYFTDGLFNTIASHWIIIGGLALVAITPVYLTLCDEEPSEKIDGALAVGAWISGRRDLPGQNQAMVYYALGWLIKFIFIPIMLNFAWDSAETISAWEWPVLTAESLTTPEGFGFVYETAMLLIFFVEYIVVVVGYCCTLKLFNTHIRTTDQSGFGWLACLACYGPLWMALYPAYLAYGNQSYWQGALEHMSTGFIVIWGIAILLLSICYVRCTIAFGLRFSNLTNRGIITNGPYRWFKHPAYLVKNISFWMISVPFIPTAGISEAIRTCLLLLLVNGLYYVRARTEENHLRSDPDYVAYESWMAQNSLFAKLRHGWAAV